MTLDPEEARLLEKAASAGAEIQDDGTTIVSTASIINFTDSIAANSPSSGEADVFVADAGINTTELANDSVTQAKVAADAIGSSEIQTDAVGSDEIAANAVGSSEIADNAVGSAEIGTDAVGEDEIDLSITPTWTGVHTFDASFDLNPVVIPSGASVGSDSTRTTVIGISATGGGARNTAVGYNITIDNTADDSVAFGSDAFVDGASRSVAIGEGSKAGVDDNVAVGHDASAGGFSSIAIGRQAGGDAQSFRSIAIGSQSQTTGTDSVAIGDGATLSTDDLARIGTNQLVFGGVRDTISDSNINNSEITIEIDERTDSSRLFSRLKDSGGTVTTGPKFSVGEDPGAFGSIYDASITTTPTAGDEESYSFAINTSDILKIYTEADGSGGIMNRQIRAEMDGSASNPAYTFGSDSDVGLFRIEFNGLGFTANGTEIMRVQGVANELDLRGNLITGLGGTNPAQTGALRLANNSEIAARDSGDANDIQLINLDVNDDIEIGRTTGGGDINPGNIAFGARIFVPSGDASGPGYAFLGDADNGMFLQASDTIAFSTGGTEALRIHSNQLIDVRNNNLRIATGQAIEDGGGNARLSNIGQAAQTLIYPNRGGGSDTQAVQLQTVLESGITELQGSDGAGNTTTLT